MEFPGKHLSHKSSRTPGERMETLVNWINCKDEEEQAVNQFVLLHNGTMCDISERINTPQGSLALSCGEFFHLLGCFKDIFSAVMDCSCELLS